MEIVGDGNCRNGYHKVKCQVPETEELHRRERGGENKPTSATAGLPLPDINTNDRKLSFSWWVLAKRRRSCNHWHHKIRILIICMKSKNKYSSEEQARPLTHRKHPLSPSCGRTWLVSLLRWRWGAAKECCSPDPSRRCSVWETNVKLSIFTLH